MRKLYLLLILCSVSAFAQVAPPQINLSGNIGAQGFPVLNSGVLQFTSDANHTMTAQESSATGGIKVTSTVPLTATRNLILPSGNFQFIAVENATTGGQSIQVIGQSGTGVTIANGASATVWFDGTNVVQTGSSSSSGPILQTNGTNNGSQTTLNLVSGTGATVTNSGANVTISASGSGSTGAQGTVQVAGATSGTFAAGTSTNIQNGIGPGVYVSATKVNNGPIFLFGTSVTEGVGSYINGNSYADILATDSANGMQDWGRGGDQAADMVPQVFRKYPQQSNFRPSLSILDPFINDANHCGNTTGCLANAAEALNASIAWTAIPATYRTYATAATNSGFANGYTPFTDISLPEIGMSTTTQNATLTFSLTNAGSEVGVTFGACDAYTAATFTVTLGGTLVDTINPIGNNGQTILTQNGASCTLFRKEYANSSGATVSLVIQKTDATTSAAGTVSIWAVDTNPSGAGTGAPVVFTEGTIMQNANANSAATAAFDAQANTTATAFATDGWNSYYVPLRSGQTGATPGVNSSTDMVNNPPINPNDNVGLHPNSGPGGGHFHLAQTIENFATAQGMDFFNVGVSGGHQFFYAPIQAFMHYAPANILGYNNFDADSTLSTTALNPGGILTNGYAAPGGSGTFAGMDFGYDSSIPAYIGRSFGPAYYEICPIPSATIPKQQSDFGCGHDIWWSNGDYVKPFGFWRPKGGISYENQSAGIGHGSATNTDRGANVNFINTSAGATSWMLPLCKANTYDYQIWYYKDTGDTNAITFNAYNTADSINGNTSTVTGTITAYSIASNVGTFTATNSLAVGQAVTLSGFGTSTFLNGVNGTITAASGTSFSMAVGHANASATEAGAFGVNAAWTGMSAPYSAAVVQCSIGPTGANTISIGQLGTGISGITSATSGDLLQADSHGNPSDSGIAASNVPLLNASNVFTGTTNTFGTFSVGTVGLGSTGFSAQAGQVATSSTNYNSPLYGNTGNYWNGTASAQDSWFTTFVLGSGANPTSTLTFTHSGSSGAASVSLPALKTSAYTVGTLPSASSLPAGTQVTVSDDSGLPTSNTCTGSGTEYAIAITNGTTWTCH